MSKACLFSVQQHMKCKYILKTTQCVHRYEVLLHIADFGGATEAGFGLLLSHTGSPTGPGKVRQPRLCRE